MKPKKIKISRNNQYPHKFKTIFMSAYYKRRRWFGYETAVNARGNFKSACWYQGLALSWRGNRYFETKED
jgi:hypothetical protein